MVSIGALSAQAADFYCKKDAEALHVYQQESAGVSSALQKKELELRELYAYDSIDIRKVAVLEAEIKTLKSSLERIAQKNGLTACSHA